MSNSTHKKILVIMSTYNGEKYLHEQIDSILNQKTDYDYSHGTDSFLSLLNHYSLILESRSPRLVEAFS